MKLAIYTQIRENYGDADKPYWKCKGGSVYVVPNLTQKQVAKIKESGIPTLSSLINTRNSGFEEYVVSWDIVNDGDKVCEPWDMPFELFYEFNKWFARRTTKNDEYGYLHQAVASKSEEYEMLPNGERGRYGVVYAMRNGDVVTSDNVNAYLTKYNETVAA